jgi:mannose-6-phosphate isomerase-like protein (cupin superfamily)
MVILCTDRVKVKKITLDPGESTTLERRPDAAKYYFVVSGRCTLYMGENKQHSFALTTNMQVPYRVWHYLENTSQEVTEVLEVIYG